MFASELHLNGADILPNGSEVLPHALAPRVDLLRVHAIFGMQILNLPIGEHPVELVLDLVLGAQPGSQSKALLFPGQFQQIGALPHDGGAAGGHLEDLLLRGLPCNDIEFLDLGLPEQAPGAAGEDRGGGTRVELRRGESGGGLRGGLGLGGDLDQSGGGCGLEGLGVEEGESWGLLPWDFDGGFGGGEGGGEEGCLSRHGHGGGNWKWRIWIGNGGLGRLIMKLCFLFFGGGGDLGVDKMILVWPIRISDFDTQSSAHPQLLYILSFFPTHFPKCKAKRQKKR